MNFSSLEMYEVIEADECVVIVKRGTRLGGMLGTPLIAGPIQACLEYLQRYTTARMDGCNQAEAHTWALTGARIVSANEALPS